MFAVFLDTAKRRLLSLKSRVSKPDSERSNRRGNPWLRYSLAALVLVVLGIQLTGIGWSEVVRHVPANPWFYGIQVVIFFLLPLAEILIYRQTWSYRFGDAFKAFVKKRVLNNDVLGYSGEVFLFSWARRRLRLPAADLARVIRDFNIVSSLTSTMVAVVVAAAVLWTAPFLQDTKGLQNAVLCGTSAIVVAVALIWAASYVRRYKFSLGGRTVVRTSAVHAGRLLLGNGLHILQWALVLPLVPLHTWLILAAAQIVVTRIPFLPSRDLLFVAIGIELVVALPLAQAAFVGLILVSSACNKVLGLSLYALFTLRESRLQRATLPVSAT